jgi:hypothetical protein
VCARLLGSEETNFGGSTFEKNGSGGGVRGIIVQHPASMMDVLTKGHEGAGHHLRLYHSIIINSHYPHSLLKKNVEKKC